MINLFKLLGTLIILIISTLVSAQVNNSYLNQSISVNEADSGKFGFSATVFNYLRNTEYFNEIELGRTLFGYQVIPSLSYQPNRNIKIQAGVFVRNDFGGETSVIPTFTVKTKYKDLEMLFGTLEGATSHQIIEPMFDIARNIEHPLENGFQLKYQKPKTYLDIWINWEKFIERGSPYKEQFTAGINYTQLLNKPNNNFKVYTVLQGMLSHAGGQIDADWVNKLTMRANYALGFKTSYEITKNQKVVFDTYWLGYKDTGDTLVFKYKDNGAAFYSNISYQYSNLQFMLSYFESSYFISPRGTAIYQCQSIDNPAYKTYGRSLIIPRIMYNKTLFNQLQMSARFEPVVDIQNHIFDYSYSFYLKYYFEKTFR
ncbi:MAG: hypothetical protein ACOYMA_05260 [Bacteroidia bacterium]